MSILSLLKYSLGLVTKELELSRKKKQALDALSSVGKISKPTYDQLETELREAMTGLEGHLKTLMSKMAVRAQELEEQVSTLELFLASLEIHHAAGDVDDKTYEEQSNAILLGLDATKQELSELRASLSPPAPETAKAPLESAPTKVLEAEELAAVEEEEIEEEPLAFEPVESIRPSQETTTESTHTEAAKSEAPLPSTLSEEPS